MRFIELLRLIKNNLLRMKLRVLMTSAGVFIGTTAIILLLSMGAGLQRFVLESFGDLGDLTELQVTAPGGGFFFGGDVIDTPGQSDTVLNDRTIEQFQQLPGVAAVTPLLQLQGGGMLRLNRYTGFATIQGIDTLALRDFNYEVESGTADSLGPWQVVVGSRVAGNFFDPQTGQPVADDLNLQGQTLQLSLTRLLADGQPSERTVRLRVVGVLAESGGQRDFSVYLPLQNVQDLNSWATGRRANPGRDGYQQALVKVETPAQATAVEQAITAQGFFVFSMQTILRSVNTVFLVIQLIVGGIGALALLVAAFGIANTMIMSIYERTREIGLMKAVGATNREVMLIFLGEAGAIGMVGGIGGVIVGVGLAQILGIIGRQYLLAQMAQGGVSDQMISAPVFTPLWLPLFAIAFATLIGVVSGIYPALRAIRLDPIAALRYE
jgi:putative ABC transport system permease protein